MKFRDLEKVRIIIKDATGLDISYAYDDLVFSEHAVFLLQFDDNNENNFFCYFHKDCIPKEQKSIVKSLTEVCKKKGCTLIPKGAFTLKQKGKKLDIHFS